MVVYRLTNKKHSTNLSGTGAAKFGGRWNKKGTPVLYTGESIEIALLEIVVNTPVSIIPQLDLLTLEIPDGPLSEITIKQLPKNWKDYPAPTVLSEIGEDWVRSGQTLALKVPSCVVQTSHNYILNCQHPDYHKVKIINKIDFYFDSRLKK